MIYSNINRPFVIRYSSSGWVWDGPNTESRAKIVSTRTEIEITKHSGVDYILLKDLLALSDSAEFSVSRGRTQYESVQIRTGEEILKDICSSKPREIVYIEYLRFYDD